MAGWRRKRSGQVEADRRITHPRARQRCTCDARAGGQSRRRLVRVVARHRTIPRASRRPLTVRGIRSQGHRAGHRLARGSSSAKRTGAGRAGLRRTLEACRGDRAGTLRSTDAAATRRPAVGGQRQPVVVAARGGDFRSSDHDRGELSQRGGAVPQGPLSVRAPPSARAVCEGRAGRPGAFGTGRHGDRSCYSVGGPVISRDRRQRVFRGRSAPVSRPAGRRPGQPRPHTRFP